LRAAVIVNSSLQLAREFKDKPTAASFNF
jgi:hypothetical protein